MMEPDSNTGSIFLCFFFLFDCLLLADFQVIKTRYLYVLQIQIVSKWERMFILKLFRHCARTFSKYIQTYGYQWERGMEEGWIGGLGSVGANYYT